MLYKGAHLGFSTNFATVFITTYCALKIEQVIRHKKVAIIILLQLCYTRWTYFKYSKNGISKADISSMTQKSTTSCFTLKV